MNKYIIDMKLPSLNEEWRNIEGYEGLYQVSNYGRVKSLDRLVNQKHYSGCNTKHLYKGKILKLRKSYNGYIFAYLTKNKIQKKYLVHRLVARAFLKRESNEDYVNHLNCDLTNNTVENLEWCTQSHNIKYAYDNNTKMPPHMRKVNQYDLLGNFVKQYDSLNEASRCTGTYSANIRKCCLGKRNQTGGYKWKYTE